MSAWHIAATTSGPYPARPGNRLRALIGGEEIARRLGEAVGEARHRVWLTVAFYSPDFLFPDGMGPLFDVLDRAVTRDVDVRLLMWRPNPETRPNPRIFGGTPEHRALLAARGSRFKIRWDRAGRAFCQHQKSWLVDGTAFVGGLNLTRIAMERHDVYLEIAGPSATDVAHNFVERWNAASERHAPDGNWACDGADTLSCPDGVWPPAGSSIVQIQRMLEHKVERSILEQYQRAIDAARCTIYIENQAIPIPPIAKHLAAALQRGVDVVLLVPPVPEAYVYEARLDPRHAALFDGVEALGRHENFLLAGLPQYVHAKLMLVDDAWATIGSCNLHAYSLGGNAERNASVWDAAAVHDLRIRLLRRHLGVDTSGLEDRVALRLFRDLARQNRAPAFALSPETYARPPAAERGGIQDRRR
jgi:phosphatidylserine/phosphatidylglycerophosphate/cardiolipin synthase-like enzyme